MRVQNLKWLFPVCCWALYPLLFLYTHNSGVCTIDQLWRPLGVLVAGASIVWLLSTAVFRSGAKGSVVTCALLALFFSYGHFEAALLRYEFEWGSWVIGPNKILVPVYIFLLTIMFWWVARTRRNLDELMRTMTAIGVLLCLMALVPGLRIGSSPGSARSGPPERQPLALEVPAAAGMPPPIYLIVLDAYAGEQVLREMYGFDNSRFLDGLRDRGFFVARGSHSNYPQSLLSMASMLNFSYLEELLPDIDEEENSRQPLQRLLRDNRLFNSLRPLGYRSITFDAAGWEALNIQHSDLFFETPGLGLSSLENELVNTSFAAFLTRFGSKDGVDARTEQHRRRIEYALDTLEHLPDQEGPFIAYAHIGCPHQPFVFGPNGEPVSQTSNRFSTWFTGNQVPDREAYHQGYLRQLQYMNHRVERLLDQLLAPEHTRPIILLVSDHGPAMELHTGSAEETNLVERFSNLVAVHYPDADYGALYNSIGAVNVFRSMLNTQFQASLELLPERQYFASWSRPYRMIPVPTEP